MNLLSFIQTNVEFYWQNKRVTTSLGLQRAHQQRLLMLPLLDEEQIVILRQ
jgi:hypothetical protein